MNSLPTINSREDLDSLQGTPEYDKFMELLKGSMTIKQDIAVYPDGYGSPDYEGEKINPVWTDIEDLSMIKRFGFSKEDFV